MSIDEITAIARRRYETGDYGSAHFKVAPQVLDAMRQQTPPKPPAYAGALGNLIGIPVVVDETLPDGHWQLVNTSSGDVLHSGDIEAAD